MSCLFFYRFNFWQVNIWTISFLERFIFKQGQFLTWFFLERFIFGQVGFCTGLLLNMLIFGQVNFLIFYFWKHFFWTGWFFNRFIYGQVIFGYVHFWKCSFGIGSLLWDPHKCTLTHHILEYPLWLKVDTNTVYKQYNSVSINSVNHINTLLRYVCDHRGALFK